MQLLVVGAETAQPFDAKLDMSCSGCVVRFHSTRGMRFDAPELGAWYAADDIRTAAAEVGHHLGRETVARNVTTMTRTYRSYAATLLGDYLDIRGERTTRPDVHASDRYDASRWGGARTEELAAWRHFCVCGSCASTSSLCRLRSVGGVVYGRATKAARTAEPGIESG